MLIVDHKGTMSALVQKKSSIISLAVHTTILMLSLNMNQQIIILQLCRLPYYIEVLNKLQIVMSGNFRTLTDGFKLVKND